jgi:cation diffusion facilitator family transporter
LGQPFPAAAPEQLLRARYQRGSTTKSVLAALTGDLLVAVTKSFAAAFTGSAAMLSEAIHSFVDSTNELLLLYGIHRASQKADVEHPFGHGREIYFWSFVVSLLIFALGASFSIYQGVGRIVNPRPIESPFVNYIVLALAFVFEGGSWLVAVRQFDRTKGEQGLLEAVRSSKDPPSFMTFLADSVAMLGLGIAALTTYLAGALGRPDIDGIGSVAIGLLLAATSLFLARESKSLLIGERADLAVRESILAIANGQPGCLKANGLFTVQLGPQQIVAMLSLEFADGMDATRIEDTVLELEHRVREANPDVVALFVKPQTAKTFQDQLNTLEGAGDGPE